MYRDYPTYQCQNRCFTGVHGSALFTRGETQALVVTTLGSDRDAQLVESFRWHREMSLYVAL